MTDTVVEQPGTLPPVQGGQNAFGQDNPSQKVVPALPQDAGGDVHASKLDEILALVRDGKGKEAAELIPDKPDKSEDKPGNTQEPKQEAPQEKVQYTGNKALDIAVSAFVDSTGASVEDITKAMQGAYEAQDARYIDRDFLKSRFGDKADQAIALAEAVFETDTKAQQDLLDSVYSVAGGKEQFEAFSAAFKEHAKPAMRTVVRNMLDSGDPEAVREAASLIAEFGKQSGVTVDVQGSRHTPGAGAAPGQGLSAQEFQLARQQLNSMSRSYRADLDKLIEQRRLGKQLGK